MAVSSITAAPLPPRIKALPLVGALPQVLTNFPKLLQETAPSYGDVVRIPLGSTDMVVLSHPDYLQQILRDNHKAYARGGPGSRMLSRVIGRGLLVLEGEEWLTERRLMQPYFHRKYFPVLFDAMVKAIDEIIDSIDTLATGEVVDLTPSIKRLTTTVFLRAMYSTALDLDTIAKLGIAIDKALRLSGRRGRLDGLLPKNTRLPMDTTIEESVGFVDTITDSIIAERRKLKEQPADLLGYLIEANEEDSGARLSDRQLRDECKTLILGGYDTTSGTLMWMVQLLRDHADMVNRLTDEASRAFRTPMTFERTTELEFSRRVVMETLRLRPVSWANSRFCVEDDVVGGCRIPAGTMVMIPILHLQSDPRWWDDPKTFNPDRWQEKDGGAKHNWAYIPFSGGPRVCLGEHFATLEATLALSKLYERFEIAPVEAELKKVTFDFTMQPLALPVRIRRRL